MKFVKYFIAVALILSACKGKEGAETESTAPDDAKAVCISDGVPVKSDPGKDGKWLSSLSLGESFIYLDEEFKDPTDKKQDYYKVELSDGTQAWARTYGVILNAQSAAILSETPIYKRPDLVNKTDKVFKPLEFVAIISEKDDWVEVTGAGKKKSGWIKVQYVSTNAEDVAIATLAFKSLLDKGGNVIGDSLQGFIDGLQFENSRFNGYLNSLLDEQVGSVVEESINEYEGEGEYNGEYEEEYTEESQGE